MTGRRKALAAGAAVLVLLGGAGGIAWRHYEAVHEDFSDCPASPEAAHPERTGIAGLREVRFPRADGKHVAGWYAPSRSGASVLLMHGTNADRTALLYETRALAQAGFGVLALDWAGCGASEGTIDWGAGERSTLEAAVDWLSRQQGTDSTRIGAYGFSMGAHMLAQVAALDPRLRAVVLAGPPSDIPLLYRTRHTRWGPLSEWPAEWAFERSTGDGWAGVTVVQAAPRIAPRPVLVVGGSLDPVVSEAMARRVFDAAREPKELWIVRGAGH
ncbi:MAG: alpha/beta hydrolase, partial [Polyangiaceae bacterium]